MIGRRPRIRRARGAGRALALVVATVASALDRRRVTVVSEVS
ncbi:hypothetical protein Ae406Ps2_1287c [Pseudonocardia sp. Ae406_Ps2]|nr:hypothetical protein Ae406Ps2_1287c [Pseudonocardia sp. Ae406_Ps2]OLM06916.1 hypothetical protein Ae331Ps2_4626 [Pseudonocardia sp. Ae331_Ps2]OLM14092.1 hypothetical protein Ae505Ps2_4222 [Pseudonocardia sp. Ae505_Ps2]OLM22860.1 hypothetical protein Ae706Ps2_1292c [Pseudonocardia sp. Ae706_Ps2]